MQLRDGDLAWMESSAEDLTVSVAVPPAGRMFVEARAWVAGEGAMTITADGQVVAQSRVADLPGLHELVAVAILEREPGATVTLSAVVDGVWSSTPQMPYLLASENYLRDGYLRL